jgi:A/G-specific adenine glycosylase
VKKTNTDRIKTALLRWYRENPRAMPWKKTRNPYLIWLSEIILQQTRVSQGFQYYRKFSSKYPNVTLLANATLDQVLKDWQGLGYNNRARNMHFTAKYIAGELEGRFPSTYDEIKKLKGVGDYTAAAIASFAFGIRKPVVDANVYRVLSRIYCLRDKIGSGALKKKTFQYASTLIQGVNPADFNQAIMNFGAMVCTPSSPECSICPIQPYCKAYNQSSVSKFPAKPQKRNKKQRFFHYFVIQYEGQVVLQRRTGNDIWQQMFDFPLLEKKSVNTIPAAIRKRFLSEITESGFIYRGKTKTYKQSLTHRKIHAVFYQYVASSLDGLDKKYYLANQENLGNFALPKIIDCYFTDKSILLE